MNLKLQGVSYKASPIAKREAVYRELLKRRVRFFSTCNRIEYYGEAQGLDWDYSFDRREDIFRHLLRLGCGLESAVLGEREIVGQLASFTKESNGDLTDLINEALAQAKELRRRFTLDSRYTIADCVLNHARRNSFSGKHLAIVGSGIVAGLLAERFSGKFKLNFISGKNKYRARQLAHKFSGFAYDRKNIHKAIDGADIVICATNSPHYILEKKHLNRDCVVYDLAMPRNVAPEIKAYDLDSFSLELEELNSFVSAQAAACAQVIEELLCVYA